MTISDIIESCVLIQKECLPALMPFVYLLTLVALLKFYWTIPPAASISSGRGGGPRSTIEGHTKHKCFLCIGCKKVFEYTN